MAKVITAAQVAELVKDGDALCMQGIICTSVPEDLLQKLRARYESGGSPKNIMCIAPVSVQGNTG